MKKKLLPISILGLTFVLTGCQNTNPDPVPPIDDEETVNKICDEIIKNIASIKEKIGNL